MKSAMEINREYLESLSTSDLLALADDNGIDVPDGLPRQILIGEILSDVQNPAKSVMADPTVYAPEDAFAFNRDSISFLLRNPGWGYVSWTIRDSEKIELMQKSNFGGFFLRVFSVAAAENGGATSFYDIAVTGDDKSWYIYLDTSVFSYWVSICCKIGTSVTMLAQSREIRIPVSCLRHIDNSTIPEESPLMRLSGIEDAYKLQFRQHRQTFQ